MKITREAKTGIIAIIIIAGAIWGYNFLKGKNILSPTDEYFVAYEHIDGIIESGAVYYHGYQVGNITDILFNSAKPDLFYLRIVLQKGFKVPLGTKVMAKETNMIAGAKDLQLIFSDAHTYHSPGDTLAPAYDKGIMGLLEPLQNSLEDVVTNLNETLESLNNTLNPQMQADLQASIKNLNNTSKYLMVAVSPGGDLGKTFSNVEQITGSMADNSEALENTMANLSSITSSVDSADLGKTLLKLDSTLASTNAIMAKVNNSEGSAGLIVNDSSLYLNLASATASLDSLLVDLKENPKRYVQFSLFGGKDKSK
jgi:phospholipid/cholesterol/gamma-HCH transport system substrate-binding protein